MGCGTSKVGSGKAAIHATAITEAGPARPAPTEKKDRAVDGQPAAAAEAPTAIVQDEAGRAVGRPQSSASPEIKSPAGPALEHASHTLEKPVTLKSTEQIASRAEEQLDRNAVPPSIESQAVPDLAERETRELVTEPEDGSKQQTQLEVPEIQSEIAPSPAASKIVIRKNIDTMPEVEQERFVRALKQMMQNTDGPGTSEYARLAGYHGWPNDYCHHGQETFPAWHRAYLVDFEHALQNADRALGGDGSLGLPYWDWASSPRIPPVIRKHFSDIPDGLVDPMGGAQRLADRGYRLNSDEDVEALLADAQVVADAQEALSCQLHWQFASTRFTIGTSIEQPHNMVHVAAGFPMSSVAFAAFHPVFFLHHCQIDRYLEKYLQLEGIYECKDEFIAQQRMLAENGEQNRYDAPLNPFLHPVSGEPFKCADTFDCRALMFQYDSLPELQPPQMREMPIYAMLTHLDPTKFTDTSYTINIFVTRANTSFDPPASPKRVRSSPAFAGRTMVFAGRQARCGNCDARDPFNLKVDITAALERLQLKSDFEEARICFTIERDDDNPATPDDYALFPKPIIRTPWSHTTLARTDKVDAVKEVRRLQLILSTKGFYHGNLDGVYGSATETAVAAYQEAFNIQDVAGTLGPATRRHLTQMRMDPLPLTEGPSSVQITIPPDGRVKYWVGEQPGYIDRNSYLAEVDLALKSWASVCGIQFIRSLNRSDATFSVRFGTAAVADMDFAVDFTGSDGQGGKLAWATTDGIIFDWGERWLLREDTQPRRSGKQYELLPVLQHEIGHLLGLEHTFDIGDAMFPYYRPGRSIELSENDIARAVALHGPPTT